MKSLLFGISAFLFLLPFTSHAQKTYYDKQWHEVYAYEQQGLPQSASRVTAEIYAYAHKRNDISQVVKALIFQSKFIAQTDEDAPFTIVARLKTAKSTAPAPLRNILESILGKVYLEYFNTHRWEFYGYDRQRTPADTADFRTWNTDMMLTEMHRCYQRSLQGPAMLQATGLTIISDVVDTAKESRLYRPTLYDFLAHEALSFYDGVGGDTPWEMKNLVRPTVPLLEPIDFSQVTSTDSLSFPAQAVRLLQELTTFHRQRQDTAAYVAVEIERLEHMAAPHAEAAVEARHRALLRRLRDDVIHHPASTLADVALAMLLIENREEDSPALLRRREALAVCNGALARFPDSHGGKRCRTIRDNLLLTTLKITAEDFVPLQAPSRLLVQYTNLDSLQVTVYPVTNAQQNALRALSYDGDSLLATLRSFAHPVVVRAFLLRNPGDYREHTTEISLPALPAGEYFVVVRSGAYAAYTKTQVTNIALLTLSGPWQDRHQIVDRTHGAPLAGARISLYEQEWGDTTRHWREFVADDRGFFTLARDTASHDIPEVFIRYGDDHGRFVSISRPEAFDRTERLPFASMMLLTDRSLYRPGQVVYFKGVVARQTMDSTLAIPDRAIQVFLQDDNHVLDSLAVKTNAFGSFTGQFTLPMGGMTGSFGITARPAPADSTYFNTFESFPRGRVQFFVEEYKRPTFTVTFAPVIETVRIDDSVKVTGVATALHGAPIVGGSVVYRVTRRYHEYMDSEILDTGKVVTGPDGTFSVALLLARGNRLPPEKDQVFTYQVTADVTDLRGETRSGDLTISAGYHMLMLDIDGPVTIDRRTTVHTLSVTGKNVNGHPIPAKGIVKVYKIVAPPLARPLPWFAPDLPIYSRVELARLFPHDDNANSYTEPRPQNTLVFSGTFNTEISNTITLHPTATWPLGNYLVTLEATDAADSVARCRHEFELTDISGKAIADNTLLVLDINKSDYAPGEVVKVTVGSAAAGLTLTVDVEAGKKIVATYIVKTTGTLQEIAIPVTEALQPGFSVHASGAAYNSLLSLSVIGSVTRPAPSLPITAETFRDKLLPGTPQSWRFAIRNPLATPAEAEVLASMYDMSLDQFNPHRWRATFRWPELYPIWHSLDGDQSFGTAAVTGTTANGTSAYHYPLQFDRWDWYGFTLNGQADRVYATRLHLLLSGPRQAKITQRHVKNLVKGYCYGTVTNLAGNPLEGVQVSVRHSATYTSTDAAGHYRVEASRNDTLDFNAIGYFGYRDAYVCVGRHNTIDVVMLDGGEILAHLLSFNLTMASDTTASDGEIVMSEPVAMPDAAPMMVTSYSFNTYSEGDIVDEPTDVSDDTPPATADITRMAVRSNFNETAFFFPQLTTNARGEVQFSFTGPEALTRWKLQLLAHTKDLRTGLKTLETVTQKELMITPNAPRFLRTGDSVYFSANVDNLTDKPLEGAVTLQLTNPATGSPLDSAFAHTVTQQFFTTAAHGSTAVSFMLTVPAGLDAVQYKIVGRAGSFSDGEQNVIPVLSNRVLITEAIPLTLKSRETKTVALDLWKSAGAAQQDQRLTVEVTSNPVWLAIQALPYLMEYPYECAEQTFARYYANSLASFIAHRDPRIRTVLDAWKTSGAPVSALEKNAELKSILLAETPWVYAAQHETAQAARLATLFGPRTLSTQSYAITRKLANLQLPDGGFPWFAGTHANAFITRHIVSSYGHLRQLDALAGDTSLMPVIRHALLYLDAQLVADQQKVLAARKHTTRLPSTEREDRLHYLYLRTFYPDVSQSAATRAAAKYFRDEAGAHWQTYTPYAQGLTALVLYRHENTATANAILRALKETSLHSDALGIYWKTNTAGYSWHQAPIETQALLIEAFAEIGGDSERATVDAMRTWLLKNKQGSQWPTTKATTEAIYALLIHGTDWLASDNPVEITLAGTRLAPDTQHPSEAGTGYSKHTWQGPAATAAMGSATFYNPGNGIAWASIYHQHVQSLDQVTSTDGALTVKKQVYRVSHTSAGEHLTALGENTTLAPGDLLRVSLELRADRALEFIHLKDLRAAGVEPTAVLSQYTWQGVLGYYQSTKDASTNFFFDTLPRGVHTLTYDVRVSQRGSFTVGMATVQSMYAPEFTSHSAGGAILVK
jgi:hypothetical protein